jgi:hypothetical protein
MANRFYLQQPNSSNCLRAFNIVQDSLPITIKNITTYSSSTNILGSDIVKGIISLTGSIATPFATGSQLLSAMLPSSLVLANGMITGSSNFGIQPNLQSLSTGASISCKFLNAGAGTITYSAADSSFDVSGVQPITQATLTNRNLDFILTSINPVQFKVIG